MNKIKNSHFPLDERWNIVANFIFYASLFKPPPTSMHDDTNKIINVHLQQEC